MRVVVALGGNALLQRGQSPSIEHQLANVRTACAAVAPVAAAHELVVAHGNGPQVGLLALQGEAYAAVPPYPLDILDAETQGQVGYLLARELGNHLGRTRPIVTVLTMVAVDGDDPAFGDPTKPIGPRYRPDQVAALEAEHGWTFRPDGDALRRVVASPRPRAIVELPQIRLLVEAGCVVVCAGGGGIPTVVDPSGGRRGVEAVVDKDHAAALLAADLGADVYVLATDVDAVHLGHGTPDQRAIARAGPEYLLDQHRAEFEPGSMLPKVEAACRFARDTGGRAVIGSIDDITALVAGQAGTVISAACDGIDLR